MDYALTLQTSAQKTSEESRKVNPIWYRPLLKMACYLEITVFVSALQYCDKGGGGRWGSDSLEKIKGLLRDNFFIAKHKSCFFLNPLYLFFIIYPRCRNILCV